MKKYEDKFTDKKEFYRFWRDLWTALKKEEEYVPIPKEETSPYNYLNSTPGDFKMFLNNTSIHAISEIRRFLHPQGVIEVIDIFTPAVSGYSSFRDPVKYDGTVKFCTLIKLLFCTPFRGAYNL